MASENKKTRKNAFDKDRMKSSSEIPQIPKSVKVTAIKKVEQPMLFEKASSRKGSALGGTVYELIECKTLDINLPIYLQINSNNIFRYFAAALISPRFTDNSSFADVQSPNPNALTLSNGFVGNVQEQTILLELALDQIELNKLKIIDGVALLDIPLPISRVKNILVPSMDIMQQIVSTATVGDGGIIPERLFRSFESKHLLFPLPKVDFVEQPKPEKNVLFDKILGAFAYLKNYNILLSNRTGMAKSLPEHFLTAAKTLNSNYSWNIDNERVAGFYKILFGMSHDDQPPLQWLVKRMFQGDNFTDNDVFAFADYIASTREDFFNEAREMFNSLIKSLERKQAIRDIPQLKNVEKFYLYLFAVLRHYGNLNTEDKSISRADLPELVFPGYGEYTFACLGYFYGYANLRNYEDRIKLNDPVFDQLFTKEKRLALKFTLDTALDLSLIESVYQYVYNSRTETLISDYRGFPQLNVELIRRPQGIEGRYSFDGVVSYGKGIYKLARKSDLDRLEKLLQHVQILPGISVIGARCYRNSLPLCAVPLTDLGKVENKNAFYYKKEDLLLAVKNGTLKSNEVIEDIMFGLSFKEF